MVSRPLSIVAVVALCLAVPLLAGCQDARSAAASRLSAQESAPVMAAPGAEVDGVIPAELAGGLPVWPGARVEDVTDAGEDAVSFTLAAAEDYGDVVAGVGAGFEEAGWQVAQAAEEGSSTALDVVGAGYEGVVTVTAAKPSGAMIEYLLERAAK